MGFTLRGLNNFKDFLKNGRSGLVRPRMASLPQSLPNSPHKP